MSKTYLTAAGSILTVESRHSAYIRGKLNESPYPQAFDAPLTLNEVYSLASPFITSCPKDNPALPVKAFPTLTLDPNAGTVRTGSTVTLQTPVRHCSALTHTLQLLTCPAGLYAHWRQWCQALCCLHRRYWANNCRRYSR